MSLRKETTTALVDGWGDARQPPWTPFERDAIGDKLVAISTAVTPHLLADAPLDDASTQQFLLLRAQSAVDAWLIRAAAGMRASLPMGLRVRTPQGLPALGLRSARIEEIDAIEGIGRERAVAIARALALHDGIDRIDDLDRVDGVGAAMLNRLGSLGYLDRPSTALVSPSLLAFCTTPTAVSYLALLERSDIEVFHGDANRLANKPPVGGSAFSRFLRLLDLVHDDAVRRISPLSAALATQATRMLSRQALHRRYLDALTVTDGAIAVNEGYRTAMLALIAAAGNRLRLMYFVATASNQNGDGIGSGDIIDALEARVAAGVAVQVIVDRDRPEDPYHSAQINRPVIQRLRAAGIDVKQDQREVLLHSKYTVADQASVIVGSHNLTTSSIARTHEVSVRMDSPTLAEVFADRFDALWAALP